MSWTQPIADASIPPRTQRPWSQVHVTWASSGQLEAQPRAQTGGLMSHAIAEGSQAPQPHQYGWQLQAPSEP
jgi:hypothetical protein